MDFVKNEKFLRALSKKFSYIYSIDQDDLFGEFQLEYLKIKNKYNKDKGTSFTTFLYICCKNRVKTLRTSKKYINIENEFVETNFIQNEKSINTTNIFYLLLEKASEDTKELFSMLQKGECINQKKLTHNRIATIKDIKNKFKNIGWNWKRIIDAIEELRNIYIESYEN